MIFFFDASLYLYDFRIFYLRSTKPFTVMDDDMGKKFELLVLTRQEDYQELSNKISQVNKQLSVRIDGLIERFAELNQKMLVLTNKVSTNVK